MKGHVGGGPWCRAYKGSDIMVKTRLLYVYYHNALPTFGSELSDWFEADWSLLERVASPGSLGGVSPDMNLRV